jgi:hypothetical protein
MPSSLSTLEALVRKSLGGRDDSTANIVIDSCINYSILLAAILFEPPELLIASNITVSANSNSANISTYLSNQLDIKSVWNNTGSFKMWYIPWESWETIVPANVGAVKYFTMFGDKIYIKDTPSANTVLAVSHSTYPADVANGNETISFDHHDSFIVSTAITIARAFFEKADIEKAMSTITLPLSLSAKARQLIEGRKSGLNEALMRD